MRQNICIILDSKSRKNIYKELFKTIDLYREDRNCNTEYELHPTKEMIEKEYEDFKQKYRNTESSIMEKRLKKFGFKDVEEYIKHALKIYKWETFEKYAYNRYNIVRFEGNKCIGLYNPKGYIDFVDSIVACNKYKRFTSKNIKEFDIAEVVLPNKTEVTWDENKDYNSNKLKMKQAINRYANKNTYIAIVRVHF